MCSFIIVTHTLKNDGFKNSENSATPKHAVGRYAYGQSNWNYEKQVYYEIRGLKREEDALAFFHAYLCRDGKNNTMQQKEIIKEIHEMDKWHGLDEAGRKKWYKLLMCLNFSK